MDVSTRASPVGVSRLSSSLLSVPLSLLSEVQESETKVSRSPGLSGEGTNSPVTVGCREAEQRLNKTKPKQENIRFLLRHQLSRILELSLV